MSAVPLAGAFAKAPDGSDRSVCQYVAAHSGAVAGSKAPSSAPSSHGAGTNVPGHKFDIEFIFKKSVLE
jgi:hypothetical protein